MQAPARDQWMSLSTTQEVDVLSTGADQPFVPHNSRRVSLIIGPPSAGSAFLAWGGAAVNNSGIRFFNTAPPLVLTLDQNGSAVQGPIRVFATTAGIILSYIETLCPPECSDIKVR